MQVLQVRNVHQALPRAVDLLLATGRWRQSRNGRVLVAPWPVTTEYARPQERVLFWPQRDANPFLHLFEALWMLGGCRDVRSLARYSDNFLRYSDDGRVFHGAYGYRWRHRFDIDQLSVIARRLRQDPDDRRCVLQIWDARIDATYEGRDAPCNVAATFQRDAAGALEIAVLQRSGDIVWGVYGANAVHMSMLQEYVAARIGCPIGKYRQITVNWHAYPDTLEPIRELPDRAADAALFGGSSDPYMSASVSATPMFAELGEDAVAAFERDLHWLLREASDGFPSDAPAAGTGAFMGLAWALLYAHHLWRTLPAPARYEQSLAVVAETDGADWAEAAKNWLLRRFERWQAKQTTSRSAISQRPTCSA